MVATTAPFGATASEPAVVYLPACYEADPARRFPVLYLLHGAGNTEQQWPDVGIAAAADAVIGSGDIGPMIIVLPNGGPGLPHTLVEQVSDQLNPWADTTYRTIAQRSGRAIGGISRGGAIALLAAAAHPELFQAVGGHSPAVYEANVARVSAGLAQLGANTLLDIGDHDPLRDGVEGFAQRLTAVGVDVGALVRESGGVGVRAGGEDLGLVTGDLRAIAPVSATTSATASQEDHVENPQRPGTHPAHQQLQDQQA